MQASVGIFYIQVLNAINYPTSLSIEDKLSGDWIIAVLCLDAFFLVNQIIVLPLTCFSLLLIYIIQ